MKSLLQKALPSCCFWWKNLWLIEMGGPIRSLFQTPVDPGFLGRGAQPCAPEPVDTKELLGARLCAPTCLNTRSLLLLAALLLLSTFASGQSLEKPTISLGDALVHPLEETRLPLQLSGLEGEAIVYLELKIQFPAVPLRFARVERDESKNSLSVHTDLETDAQDPEQMAILLLELDSVETLSEGELLQLIFEATDEIFENEELIIKIVEASLWTASGDQVEELNLEDGKITISIPLFSCFFYMH